MTDSDGGGGHTMEPSKVGQLYALTGAAPSVAASAAAPASRRATSSRTTGATLVPNSSIERITSAWATAPTDICPT